MRPSTLRVLRVLRKNRRHRGGLTVAQIVMRTGQARVGARLWELEHEEGFGIERIDTPAPRRLGGYISRYRLTYDAERGK